MQALEQGYVDDIEVMSEAVTRLASEAAFEVFEAAH